MAEYLKYLNDNAGALNALFSGVVALATVVYAVLTAKLVRETRNLREVQTEPRVEVWPEVDAPTIDLQAKTQCKGAIVTIRLRILLLAILSLLLQSQPLAADTAVFGVALNSKLNIPICKNEKESYAQNPKTGICYAGHDILKQWPSKVPSSGAVEIVFPIGELPRWARGNLVA